MGLTWLDLGVRVLWAPHHAFRRVGAPGVIGVCVVLFLARWLVTPFTTVRNLHAHSSPMLLPLPLGDDPVAYRYWEQFWYAPYGVAFMLAIIATVAGMARDADFRQVFQVTAIAYFAPWVFTAASDCLIIPAGLGMPYLMVASHLGALAWSTGLMALGLMTVCRLPAIEALRFAAVAGGMFLVFGAVLMR